MWMWWVLTTILITETIEYPDALLGEHGSMHLVIKQSNGNHENENEHDDTKPIEPL